jgi:hypothetical protein
MASTTRLQWSQDAVRKLLSYVDAHKGHNSILIRNPSQAFKEISHELRPLFPRQESKNLSSKRISSKLNHFWGRNRSASYSSIGDLWRYGTKALDPAKASAIWTGSDHNDSSSQKGTADASSHSDRSGEGPGITQTQERILPVPEENRSLGQLPDHPSSSASSGYPPAPTEPSATPAANDTGSSKRQWVPFPEIDTSLLLSRKPTRKRAASESGIQGFVDSQRPTKRRSERVSSLSREHKRKRTDEEQIDEPQSHKRREMEPSARPEALSAETHPPILNKIVSSHLDVPSTANPENSQPKDPSEARSHVNDYLSAPANSRRPSPSTTSQHLTQPETGQVGGKDSNSIREPDELPLQNPKSLLEVLSDDPPRTNVSAEDLYLHDRKSDRRRLISLEALTQSPPVEASDKSVQRLNGIHTSIFLAVEGLLDDLGIPRDSAFAIDPRWPHPQDLLDILREVLGCKPEEVIAEFQKLTASQNQKHLNLYFFLRAMIASAVKLWVLDPPPHGTDATENPVYEAASQAISKRRFQLFLLQ